MESECKNCITLEKLKNAISSGDIFVITKSKALADLAFEKLQEITREINGISCIQRDRLFRQMEGE